MCFSTMAFHFLLLLATAYTVTHSAQVTDEDMKKFAVANNRLAIILYTVATQGPFLGISNFCFSPLSVMTGYGIMLYGAGGKTQEALYDFLGYKDAGLPLDKIAPTYEHYFKNYLPENDPNLSNYTLLYAVEVLISNKFPIKPEFQEKAQNIYQATIKNVDFSQPDAVRKDVNNFVDQQTHGKIKNFGKYSIDKEEARIVNAVYFKGKWETPFYHCLTMPEPFYSPTETKNVQFMQVVHSFPYYETNDFQAVFLPYAGGNIGFLILLPKERNGLSAAEDIILETPDPITDIINQLQPENTLIKLPKLEIEFHESLLLYFYSMLENKTPLEGNSNFTGITDTNGLHISYSPYTSVIEVDESSQRNGEPYDSTVIASSTVVANHPFMFAVVDIRFNLLFYIGRVYEA